MKKKIGIFLIVLAAAALLFAGYTAFLAPKAQAGTKTVTVQVVAAEKGVNRSFHYITNSSTLSQLLKENQSELKTETKSSQYGDFVNGLLGVEADASKEYFNIKVDGKDAAVGVSQLPVENGKTYTFTLTALK
jgi:hypothetical protein